MTPHPAQFNELIRLAIQEDLATGYDLSSLVLPQDQISKFGIFSRQNGILAGVFLIPHILSMVDPKLNYEILIKDGQNLKHGNLIASISGPLASVLLVERTCLNFLSHLSGVASLTAQFVAQVENTKTRIVDTRKTLPGFRALQKYAVRVGGGFNHRFGLHDMVLIKDNHWLYIGSLKKAVEEIRSMLGHAVKIEVEADSLDQFREALEARVDAVLLDNMSLNDIRTAVSENAGTVILEASGGITLENVRDYALAGVDIISIGKITHSAPALDFGLDEI